MAAALLLAAGLLAPAAPVQASGTITVTTPADEYDLVPNANCSLREAIESANTNTNFGGCTRSGASPYTINLGAGTFNLSRGGANEDNNASGDLDIRVSGTAIAGDGAANTTIQQTTDDRVIDFNPQYDNGFSGSLSNLKITGGNVVDGTLGGGGILYGTNDGLGTLTLNGVTVDNNTATQGPGGGIASGSRGNLTISNSTISNNTASSPSAGLGGRAGTGGGIDFLDQGDDNQPPNVLSISNSTISDNRAAYAAAAAGGGLHISGGAATIQRTHFVNNRAADTLRAPTGSGGAIVHLGGTLDVSFSRFVDNVATSGTAIWQSSGGYTTTANDNWWGVNTGPATGALGTPPVGGNLPTATRWLQLRHNANPTAVPTTTSTTLTADLFGRNNDGPIDSANLVGLPPFGVTFDNAVLGTLSNAATQFTDGQATATYTAGLVTGPGSADATADNQTVTVNFNVPLAVLLASFSAEAQADRVLVQWDTVSEMGNLGFNLWRGVSPDEPDRQLNASLIPSQAPGSTQGHSYQWIDQANVVAGTTYYYWLEDVDVNGVVTRHGPVSATLAAPTAVTLSGLSASPAAATVSWGLPALVTALSAAAALAFRRH